MIEYRIEFSSVGQGMTIYFKVFKYVDGVKVARIGDTIYTAAEADYLVRGIIGGEKKFVVVPKEARLVFH